MKTSTIIAIVIVILLILGVLYVVFNQNPAASSTAATTTTPVSTQQTPQPQSVTTPKGVTFSYVAPYALATTPAQILVKSVVPPCLSGFDYCLYRNGSEYAGTNFESAGLAIQQRTDLKSKTTCLTTSPSGYTNLTATTTNQSTYSTSVFGPLSDAGAGHYSTGAEYRLWFGTTCYQFDTSVGETQYANYPTGTKTLFTDEDRAVVMSELRAMLDGVAISGTPVIFPPQQ